jgi:predicted  nucleic acid-binding Zn-ribbon protein
MNEEIVRLTKENEALAERTNSLIGKLESVMETITSLENEIEELSNKLFELEDQQGASSDIEDTLKINEIDAWTINHETISQKIEKRILAKLKGLE